MATRSDLKDWTVEALAALGGSARIADICKHIWNNHESELRQSGDLFYTWQYEMRWAGQILQKEGKITKKAEGRRWAVS
jgi:hypothetical protein